MTMISSDNGLLVTVTHVAASCYHLYLINVSQGKSVLYVCLSTFSSLPVSVTEWSNTEVITSQPRPEWVLYHLTKSTNLILDLDDTDHHQPKNLNKLNRDGFILCSIPSVCVCVPSYLVAIVGPGTKGEVTFLAVKGEVGNIHHTGALGDGRSIPGDLSIVAQFHISVHRPWEVVVRSAGGEKAKTH